MTENDQTLTGGGNTSSGRRLSYDDLVLLNRHLLELVEARLPLGPGLAACATDLAGGRLEPVMRALHAELDGGKSLSEAMAARGSELPPVYRALVAAGESTGDLNAMLRLLVEQAEVDADIEVRMRSALSYPLFTLAATILVSGALCGYVLPGFRPIFDGMTIELPLITRLYLGLGEVVSGKGVVVVAVVAVLLPVVLALHGPRLMRALVYWKTPERALGEMCRALSGFLSRGLTLPRAFRALEAAHGQAFPDQVLARVVSRLEQGARLGDALRAEKAFPATFTWLVASAEESGSLPLVLADLARRYEHAFKRRLKVFETFLSPILLTGLAFFVGQMVLAVFLPIFQLTKALSQ